jgi:hypothetical protein
LGVADAMIEAKSTTESLALYEQTLKGNNAAALSIKAYMSDLKQFVLAIPNLNFIEH